MGTGVSIFLTAVSGILTFGLEADSSSGVNFDTIGLILMAVGLLGLLYSLVLVDALRPGPRRQDHVDDDMAVTRRETYLDDGPIVERRPTRPVVERQVSRRI